MTVVYLGLGSNLGDRKQNLLKAVGALQELDGLSHVRLSQIIETAPVGGPQQGDYLNAVVECHCSVEAIQLLRQVQIIEQQLKRQRSGKNHPRTIDIDILLFGDESHASHELTIPHPRMHQREFVMRPLAEFLPEYCANATANI
ncbi:MAG: 2-amino-4-hydroxy-6-hydroxymethyldihydropteridine diphosphokinase [Planctomycetota bacterium]|nr:2-amino-4-hydroxy-6-hydroxymethyldihydropteridine diphosphokinase [Planctomycetota bacterium]